MKQFDKWFFPDGEEHLPGWMQTVNNRVDGRLTYQYGKYEAALKYLKSNTLAIDIGSHVGLWAYFMARDFERVVCFEPMPAHIECWKRNMEGIENAELWEYALGNKEAMVRLETRTAGSSGDTGIVPGEGTIAMKLLDDFGLNDVSLIKIDCEGFEELVLHGAAGTLQRCKPVVIVEQKGDMSEKYGLGKTSAVNFLASLGALLRQEISGDFIMSWE